MGVAREDRGKETRRAIRRLAPRVSIIASNSTPRRDCASVAFGLGAEVLPAGVSCAIQATRFPGSAQPRCLQSARRDRRWDADIAAMGRRPTNRLASRAARRRVGDADGGRDDNAAGAPRVWLLTVVAIDTASKPGGDRRAGVAQDQPVARDVSKRQSAARHGQASGVAHASGGPSSWRVHTAWQTCRHPCPPRLAPQTARNYGRWSVTTRRITIRRSPARVVGEPQSRTVCDFGLGVRSQPLMPRCGLERDRGWVGGGDARLGQRRAPEPCDLGATRDHSRTTDQHG
jgi:hypothetical protein